MWRQFAVVLAAAGTLAACGSDNATLTPPLGESPTAVDSDFALRAQAKEYLDALVASASCDAVWKLVVSDGDPKSDFCTDLAEYRTEVRALTLGEVTESAEDYTIFAVQVDYLDGRPSVTDSEVEIDYVDGKPLVAAGLP